MDCLAVCDGRGPAFAALLPPSDDAPPLLHIDLAGKLPAHGRLGVYIRVRGDALNAMPLAIAHGLEPMAAFPLVVGSTTSFVERVVGGASGPAWRSADAAPTSINLIGVANKVGIEIDCIVPFVVPE